MSTTADEREAWFHDRVTQEFLSNLREKKQETLEAWGVGAYVAETGEQTLQFNAKALGGLDVLTQVIEVIEDCKRKDDGTDIE